MERQVSAARSISPAQQESTTLPPGITLPPGTEVSSFAVLKGVDPSFVAPTGSGQPRVLGTLQSSVNYDYLPSSSMGPAVGYEPTPSLPLQPIWQSAPAAALRQEEPTYGTLDYGPPIVGYGVVDDGPPIVGYAQGTPTYITPSYSYSVQYVPREPEPEMKAPSPPPPSPPPPIEMPSYSIGKGRTWKYGLCHTCKPVQCCILFCFPCCITYEMIWLAAPFELLGFGCIALQESAFLLTCIIWLLGFLSGGILMWIVLFSVVTGIKKKLSIHEENWRTCCKIMCCLCCFQVQIIREGEEVGLPILVTKLDDS